MEISATCNTCKKYLSTADIKYCKACKAVPYCDRACQTVDWKRHKSKCLQRSHTKLTLSELILKFLHKCDKMVLAVYATLYHALHGKGSLYIITTINNLDKYIRGNIELRLAKNLVTSKFVDAINSEGIDIRYLSDEAVKKSKVNHSALLTVFKGNHEDVEQSLEGNFVKNFYLCLFVAVEKIMCDDITDIETTQSVYMYTFRFLVNNNGTIDVMYRDHRPKLDYDLD